MSPEAASPKDQRPLSSVERLAYTGALPRSRDDLEKIVEIPLLAACQELYDKNVFTITSSANHVDVNTGFAYINIDHETLSLENCAVAEVIGAKLFTVPHPNGKQQTVASLQFPVMPTTTTAELSEDALSVARQFKKQPMIWAPSFSLPKIREDNPQLDDVTIIAELTGEGFFFDVDYETFYVSEEHYRKAKET